MRLLGGGREQWGDSQKNAGRVGERGWPGLSPFSTGSIRLSAGAGERWVSQRRVASLEPRADSMRKKPGPHLLGEEMMSEGPSSLLSWVTWKRSGLGSYLR